MTTTKQIGILGIGNLLMHDEGFGVHFIEHLQENYVLPDHVAALDGGTAGIMLAPFIEDADILYVIDTVKLDAEPGSIHCFTDEDVRSGSVQMRMSPHQVGFLDILELCKLRGQAPEDIEMITVVPKDLDLAIGLSPELAPKIKEVTKILLQSLVKHGTVLQRAVSLTSA